MKKYCGVKLPNINKQSACSWCLTQNNTKKKKMGPLTELKLFNEILI